MRLSVRNSGRYSYIVFASETVVFDDYGKPVIKCPTEAEAVEYIRNRLESEGIQDDIYAVGNTLRSIRNKYGYTQNDMAESLDVSYIHYSQIEQGRHRMSLELMLKIVTKYGVDPNTLFGIESREKHENKNLSVLEDKLQMLKPNDREYAMSTCLIFIEGLEARKEVV